MMPRQATPDPIAARIGRRIRALRREKGLTLDALAKKSEIPRSHLSRIERGLVVIRLGTILKIAHGLSEEPFQVLTFPEEDTRQQLIDALRHLSPDELTALEKELEQFSEADRKARKRS